MTTPTQPLGHAAPAVAAATLEAPPVPVPLMTATQKQRDDVARVARALRAQPREDGNVDEEEPEEDDEELDPARMGQPDPTQPVLVAGPPSPADVAAEFGVPEWFKMPGNGFPADVESGTTVIFVRFPVWLTGVAKRGERQCAQRPLTPKLERYARGKIGGTNGLDLAEEYTKASLCIIDGVQAEHFRAGEGSGNHFWAEIGPKAREVLIINFNKLHRMSTSERANFLASCVTARTVG